MLGRRAAIFTAASAVGLVGAAAHAQPVDVVVAHKSASGKHALAIALGKTVRVTSSPCASLQGRTSASRGTGVITAGSA